MRLSGQRHIKLKNLNKAVIPIEQPKNDRKKKVKHMKCFILAESSGPQDSE
jgi:hypothetical protein